MDDPAQKGCPRALGGGTRTFRACCLSKAPLLVDGVTPGWEAKVKGASRSGFASAVRPDSSRHLCPSGSCWGRGSLGNSEGVLSPQVTCRALGIGAYLVRLGQRVIQVENSHIILTGASALNKVSVKGLGVISRPLVPSSPGGVFSV